MPNSRDEEYDIWRAAASHLDDDDSDDDADIGSYHDRRNILIFDKNDSLIAGLEQRGTFTVANIYRWLSILYPLPNIWFLQSKTNAGIIPRESHAILPLGSYQIVDADFHILSPVPRSSRYMFRCLVNSHRNFTDIDNKLFDRVQRRDRRCLITGEESFSLLGCIETSFAVRIFPLVDPLQWHNPLIRELFKDLAASPITFAEALQSPANAFICQYAPSQVFNSHLFSVDVDDDYRVVQFVDCEQWGVPADGRLLVAQGDNSVPGPADDLLRAHFHQALIRWIINDPPGHRDYLTATTLAFQIHRREASPHHPCWTQEPGKSVFEAYMAQQLLGCCVELGNEFQDRFNKSPSFGQEGYVPPSEPDVYPGMTYADEPTTPLIDIFATLEKVPLTPPTPRRVSQGRYYSDSD